MHAHTCILTSGVRPVPPAFAVLSSLPQERGSLARCTYSDIPLLQAAAGIRQGGSRVTLGRRGTPGRDAEPRTTNSHASANAHAHHPAPPASHDEAVGPLGTRRSPWYMRRTRSRMQLREGWPRACRARQSPLRMTTTKVMCVARPSDAHASERAGCCAHNLSNSPPSLLDARHLHHVDETSEAVG